MPLSYTRQNVDFEFAKVSLTGHRAENQDRVDIVNEGPSTIIVEV